MKNVFQIACFIAALGVGVSQALAGTAVYVPLGETGEVVAPLNAGQAFQNVV